MAMLLANIFWCATAVPIAVLIPYLVSDSSFSPWAVVAILVLWTLTALMVRLEVIEFDLCRCLAKPSATSWQIFKWFFGGSQPY